MADDQQSVAQDDEQGDFANPGEQQDSDTPMAGQGMPQPPPQPSVAPSGAPNASAGPSSADGQPPKTSGRAMFLGNLLKTILSGVQNAQGNPNNAFDRGFAGASPAANQLREAKVSKAISEADQAKMQTSLTGMKALQTEYMLKRLPQEDQIKHMEVVAKFKEQLIKEGASVEAEGDDEKSSDAQAMHLNGTDPRAMNHSGHFWSLPTMDESGKPKFDVVYVPTKDTLQNEFTWNGADGQEHTIPAGTPMLGLPKMVEQLQKDVAGDTKEQHKQMGDALKPNVPDNEIPQTVDWLQSQKKQNTPLYQQNKNAVDAQINTLNAAHGQIHSEKKAEARAGAQMHADIKTETDTAKGEKAGEAALSYADDYLKSGDFTGPGDEALMEKFFELAKPSSGFRMTQNQMDMLRKGRGWMDSAEAIGRHAKEGVWFSKDQRQQIANTMQRLEKAKTGKTGTTATPKKADDPFAKFGGTSR